MALIQAHFSDWLIGDDLPYLPYIALRLITDRQSHDGTDGITSTADMKGIEARFASMVLKELTSNSNGGFMIGLIKEDDQNVYMWCTHLFYKIGSFCIFIISP